MELFEDLLQLNQTRTVVLSMIMGFLNKMEVQARGYFSDSRRHGNFRIYFLSASYMDCFYQRGVKTGMAYLYLTPKKYLKIRFCDDIAIECEEIQSNQIPKTFTPFEIMVESIKDDAFIDPDFPQTKESICKDEMNLEYGEYKWVSYEEASKSKVYILPKNRDLEVDFEDNTSHHLVVFLKLLAKDKRFLMSIINIPEQNIVNKKYPK
jgi:hypothetical protein